MPRLIITEQDQPEETAVPLEGGEIDLGRGEGNKVILTGEGVSRHHAKILREGEPFFLIDLGSENGTLLNGFSIKANERNLLRNNDLITIAKYHIRFWETDERVQKAIEEEEEITDTDVLEVKLLKKVLDSIDQERVPSLEVLNGSAEGKRVFLTDDTEEFVIGRDPNCDFPVNEYVISRQHAKIVKQWGGLTLRDLESKNGTFVNNKRVIEEHLHDGDRVALGTIVFLFRNPQEINLRELGEELSKKQKRQEKKKEMALQEEEHQREQEEAQESAPSATNYPAPTPAPKQLNLYELGMIGLGIIVLLFAGLTIVNLVMS